VLGEWWSTSSCTFLLCKIDLLKSEFPREQGKLETLYNANIIERSIKKTKYKVRQILPHPKVAND
jgi:hypothetical protein